MKKYSDSADFSQSSFVSVARPASDMIDTFGGSNFGNADSESLCGFGDTEPNYNPFQRRNKEGCECESVDSYDDDYEYEADHAPVNISENTDESVKSLAKIAVEKALSEKGASSEKIERVKKAIDSIQSEKVEQAVADTVAAKINTAAHPLMKFQTAKLGGGFSGMGDWFSDIRDKVLTSAGTTAQTEAQKLATTAVQAAVAPVANTLAQVANSPQAQAAMQKATQTGITQIQTALKQQISDIWKSYKIPVLVGGAALIGTTIFLIAKRRK